MNIQEFRTNINKTEMKVRASAFSPSALSITGALNVFGNAHVGGNISASSFVGGEYARPIVFIWPELDMSSVGEARWFLSPCACVVKTVSFVRLNAAGGAGTATISFFDRLRRKAKTTGTLNNATAERTVTVVTFDLDDPDDQRFCYLGAGGSGAMQVSAETGAGLTESYHVQFNLSPIIAGGSYV